MTSPSFRDIENLSGYLDGQIPPSEKTHLEKRLQSDPDFSRTLKELRQARALLQHTPQRRAPRSFRLTSGMAGIRPPVPRLVPVFSWASAVAMALFVFTLGASLAGQLAPRTAALMLAAAPSGMGAGSSAAATNAPAVAVPPPMAATMAPQANVNQNEQASPTPEANILSAPEATPSGVMRAIQPPSAPKAQHKPLSPWLVIWPSLGVLLGVLALLVVWLNQRAFHRRNPPS